MTALTTPAFLDFEASSLDLIASYPIEVGVCLPDGSLHSWLIQPHVLWLDWSESAERVHGITRETLEKEGLPIREVALALNEILSGQVFCDAWTFDSFWMHRLFRAARTLPEFQLESVAMVLTPQQVQQWAAARQRVISNLGLPIHRAANDALILQKTWQSIGQDPGNIVER
jgi:DNA polymerase III epsilon subunit-like protein